MAKKCHDNLRHNNLRQFTTISLSFFHCHKMSQNILRQFTTIYTCSEILPDSFRAFIFHPLRKRTPPPIRIAAPFWLLSLKKGKPNSTLLLFVRQYASHLFGKYWGLGVTRKFMKNIRQIPRQISHKISQQKSKEIHWRASAGAQGEMLPNE